MQIRISRVDKSLPLPSYQSNGAAAFDLYSREALEIAPKSIARVPSNLIVQTPADYALVIALRSSTPKRKGLIHPAGIGIVDPDYRGPEDEVQVQVYNVLDEIVYLERGERFAQAMIVQTPRLDFFETDVRVQTSRGGFGSTGA